MKFSFLIIAISVITLGSCKKGYTCYCYNPGGSFDYYNIHDTKKSATKKCNDYYNANYANGSFNEVNCELKTK